MEIPREIRKLALTMSKIQDMIQQLCPDGVPFVRLGDVCEIRNGYTPSKKNPKYWENGTIPWFRMEDIRKNGRVLSDSIQHITPEAVKGGKLFPANSIILATTATIGEHALIIVDSLANQRFTNLKIRKSLSSAIDAKFFFYYMFIVDDWCKNNTNPGTFASVDTKKLANFELPLPPLAIQKEITRVLDKYSAVVTELIGNLETELGLRRKQYAYYRDRLLSFAPDDPDVQWKTLGEIGTFTRGNGLQKKDFTEEGVGCIHYGQIYTRYGSSTTQTISHCSPELAKKLKKAHKGDLVIATTSENMEDVCKAVVWMGEEEICISGHTCIFSHDQDPMYIAHFFKTYNFYQQKKNFARGTKVIEIKAKDMEKIVIPLPSKARQKRIADMLDRFERLTTDLQAGIPAEINARRKQYAYYRDRLLSFPRLTD